MRIIVVSDIRGEQQGIIPYGLQLAKQLEVEVEVLHVIDPRVVHGVTSRYSDSQTIAAGSKLSHREIIEREKYHVAKELDDLLSQETSRLNFPIKLKQTIEENEILKKVLEELNRDTSSLLLINKAVDNLIFGSQRELVETCQSYGGVALVVPPKYCFQRMTNVLMPATFSNLLDEKQEHAADWIMKLAPVINIVEDDKRRVEEGARKSLESFFNTLSVNYHEFCSADFDQEYLDYATMLEPDILFVEKKRPGLVASLLKKGMMEKAFEQIKVPIACF